MNTFGWAPNRFSSLILDLNADRVAGNDGDAQAAWTNLAPTGSTYSFAQGTAGRRPLLKRNIINGRSTLLFDGVDDCMTTSGVFSNSAWTIMVAFKLAAPPSGGNFGRLVSLADATPRYADIFLSAIGGAYKPYSIIAQNGGPVTATGIADALDTNAHVLSVTYSGGTNTSTASYIVNLDGTAKAVVASSTASITVTNFSSICADVSSGGATANPLNIHMARVLYFAAALNTQQAAAGVKYLKNIYGV